LTVYLVLVERAALKVLYLFSSLFLNLAYLSVVFQTCGSKQLSILFSKKEKLPFSGNYRPIAILNNFSKCLDLSYMNMFLAILNLN
jgi:hypothetical protein